VVVAEEAEALAALALPLVWHIHEMPFVIHSYGGGQPFRNARHVAGVYIAASESVKQGLISAYGVPTEDISVIHAFAARQSR
jgi:hypothetical protein